jgi:hypothetical protein
MVRKSNVRTCVASSGFSGSIDVGKDDVAQHAGGVLVSHTEYLREPCVQGRVSERAVLLERPVTATTLSNDAVARFTNPMPSFPALMDSTDPPGWNAAHGGELSLFGVVGSGELTPVSDQALRQHLPLGGRGWRAVPTVEQVRQ